VYESASRVKELGVGINVLPHATHELTELGLLDELDAVGIPTAEISYYSKHGQRIWSEPRGIAAGYRWPQYSIHRGQLLGVLHRAVLQLLGPERVPPRPSSGTLWPECGLCMGRFREPRQRCAARARRGRRAGRL
jgi:2-polyprenyl-6-methoxyphenol hydroxylase-like FAD-dependent oxidoreductase